MAPSDFRRRFIQRHPEAQKLKEVNSVKYTNALMLRALRKEAGLTQQEVAERSGLTQSVISRLESPTGPFPRLDTIHIYTAACGGAVSIRNAAGEEVVALEDDRLAPESECAPERDGDDDAKSREAFG